MYDPAARFDGDAVVPTFEVYGLARVPGYDADNPNWRAEWFDWRGKVVDLGARIAALCDRDAGARAEEMALCAADPARFASLWLWLEEPRAMDGEDAVKRFTPFAFQVDLLQWFVDRTSSPRKLDGYVSKARGLGASWIFCAGAVWGYLFREWRGLLVSRKEALVDAPRDMNSLFGKIDFMLDYLPRWMKPEGFNRDEHRLKLRLTHPKKRNVAIDGESTSSRTGRGARATYIVYDEAAFIEGFKDVWNTGFGTSNHRFAVSTESMEEGRFWRDAWRSAQKATPEAVKELDWYHNAYQDEDWYEEEYQRAVAANDVEGFEREVNRNDRAGYGDWIYPVALELPILDDLAYDPTQVLLVGIDPGHADDTGIVWGHLRRVDGQRGVAWLDSYENNQMPVEFYAHLLTGIGPEPGDEVYGYQFTPREREIMAFFGQLPWGSDRVKFFMDPAGTAHHNGISFEDLFMVKTQALRQREQARRPVPGRVAKPILVIARAIRSLNAHKDRRNATRTLLNHSCYAATPGAMRIRECLGNRRFQKETEKTSGEPKPIHDDYSHVATACEYVSVFVHYKQAEPRPALPAAGNRRSTARRAA